MATTMEAAVMNFRRYTAIHSDDHVLDRSSLRSEYSQFRFQYQLKYKRGDAILVPTDNLGFDSPVGVNEASSKVGNICLDYLTPDDSTTQCQVHGVLLRTHPQQPAFQPNDADPLSKPTTPPDPEWEAAKWQYKSGDPFLLRSVSSEDIKAQPRRLVHLLNLRTGEPITVPFPRVKLYPNYRYTSTTPTLNPRSKSKKSPAFTYGALLTAAVLKRRDIRLGHKDKTHPLYCINIATGSAAWVLEHQLESLETVSISPYMDALPWTSGTVPNKRGRKRPSPNPLPGVTPQDEPRIKQEPADFQGFQADDREPTGSSTVVTDEDAPAETDYEEEAHDDRWFNNMPSPRSACGEYDDDGDDGGEAEGGDRSGFDGPVRVQRQQLPGGLRMRVSVDGDRPRTPGLDRFIRREQAASEARNRKKPRDPESIRQRQRMMVKHHRVPYAGALLMQLSAERERASMAGCIVKASVEWGDGAESSGREADDGDSVVSDPSTPLADAVFGPLTPSEEVDSPFDKGIACHRDSSCEPPAKIARLCE